PDLGEPDRHRDRHPGLIRDEQDLDLQQRARPVGRARRLMRRFAAIVALVVALLVAASATSHALVGLPPIGFEPLTEQTAREMGLAQPELAQAMRMRPGATVRVRFLPELDRWRVSVRYGDAATTLAFVEIDHHTRRVE